MNKVVKRAVTGFFFLAVMLLGILYHPLSFGILFTLISALAVYEFMGLVNRWTDVHVSPLIAAISASYLFLAVMTLAIGASGLEIIFPYLIMMMVCVIAQLWLKLPNPIGNWAYLMASQALVAIPFSLLNLLAFNRTDGTDAVEFTPILPLSVFIFIWVSDTFAYCTGMLIGRHRLLERVSPKKSWEGFFGGLAFSIAAAVILSRFFTLMSVWQWIGLAATIVVFGILGDLSESLMKRQMGIKDSGNILPGHGGLLDRFDSALMAIPASVAYLYFTGIL